MNHWQSDVATKLNIRTQTYNGYETLARTMGITDLVKLPAILNCRITDLLPDSVVTDYDRERAADARLREVQERWNSLPEYVQESIVFLARGAEEEKGE